MTQTFSGAHPFRPADLIAAVEYDLSDEDDDSDYIHESAVEIVSPLVELIDNGHCPRCRGPLTTREKEFPSGSRVTSCRCVPICRHCGEDEVLGIPLGAWQWPVDPATATRDLEMVSSVEEMLPREINVDELVGRPHPGGWAEYGYDDSADENERRG